MNFREHLSTVAARDSRYAIEGYLFVFDALEFTRGLRNERGSDAFRTESTTLLSDEVAEHVTGRELCLGVCRLSRAQFGLLAWSILTEWGIRTTADLGEIVFNLIAAGDLETTPSDSRADFDRLFDLEETLRADMEFDLDKPD